MKLKAITESPLSEAQQQTINQAIQEALVTTLRNFDFKRIEEITYNPRSKIKISSPRRQLILNHKILYFVLVIFEYFDPNRNKEAVEVKDSYKIYHNVFFLTTQMRIKKNSPNLTNLIQHIDLSLLGDTNNCYTEQIDDTFRIELRYIIVEAWCAAL